ncbi:MAG: hypothetical protein AAGD12_02405, partial [Pseudomonadota bacterium]
RLDAGPKGATVQFRNDSFANPAGLVEFLSERGGVAKIRDNRLVLQNALGSANARVKAAWGIARDLARKAAA